MPALACVALIVALASYTILMAIVTIVSVLVSPEVRGVARDQPAI